METFLIAKEAGYYGEHRFENTGVFNITKLLKEETAVQGLEQRHYKKYVTQQLASELLLKSASRDFFLHSILDVLLQDRLLNEAVLVLLFHVT